MTGDPNHNRRGGTRNKEVPKANITTNSASARDSGDDLLLMKIPCAYQLIFLLESASECSKYIEIYKEAVNLNVDNNCARLYGDAGDRAVCNAIVIDHNQLVNSLSHQCTEKDERFRMLHERTKIELYTSGKISGKLMVQYVRQSIIVALESLRHKWTEFDTDKHAYRPELLYIVMINFFDLEFIIEFIQIEQKVDAIVELKCKKIAQVRDKFVSRATKAEQAIVAEKIRQFWQNFHHGLNIDSKMASEFKNVVVYSYESKYNAHYEPPDIDKIVTMSRNYVMREMNRIQQFLLNVRIEYENCVKNANSIYSLQSTNEDFGHYYESYSNNLSKIPDEVLSVPVILDAMINAISPKNIADEWIDICSDGLKTESEEGCMNYPVCVQYGNECGLTVKKHNLRFTNYLDSTTNVLYAKWKKLLWGRRPLVPLETEAEYDRIIQAIKCQCEENTAGDDVDLQLCVLGLNRLRNNLDVFRGESIDLSTLGMMTRMTLEPKSLEPVCRVTLLQLLESESEKFKRMSYAYFVPEDVLLVIFYDFQVADSSTRKRLQRFTVPQWPVYIKDYFDYYHGKKKPISFYAVDANDLCSTYVEETEELRFGNDGQLTIAKRKWSFEKESMCLIYKTKRYEILRNVDGGEDDDDRFIIHCSSTGSAYYVSKSRSNVIGCVYRATDGALNEIVSGSKPGNYLVRQSNPNARASNGQLETCRSYDGNIGNRKVVVEYADKKTVTHTTTGRGETPAAAAIGVLKPSASKMRKPSVVGAPTPPENSGTTSNNVTASPPTSPPGSPQSAVEGSTRKSVSNIKSTKSKMKRVASTRKRNSAVSIAVSREDKPLKTVQEDFSPPYPPVEYSRDGTRKTLRFDDGTEISTYVQEVQRPEELSDDWVVMAVTGYEYVHPAYPSVTTDERDGAISVQGLFTRSSDGGLSLSIPGSSSDTAGVARVQVSKDSIVVYGGGDRVIATFGWKGSESNLFEKRDSRGNVQITVPDSTYSPFASGIDDVTSLIPPARFDAPFACFIVKRGISGFRVLGTDEHDKFVEEMRGRADAVLVRETPEEFTTVFGADEPTVAVTATPVGYEWLKVRVPNRDDRGTAVPKLLVCRTLRRANNNYGPVLTCLRNPPTLQHLQRRSGCTTAVVRPPRLVVRSNFPRADAVCAMYATGTSRYGQERSDVKAVLAGPSVKRDRREQKQRDAQEARMRSKRNEFIPYFQCDRYGPLRDYLIVNNLSYNKNMTGPRY
ncbi:Hypothetical protein CINCED_3A012859 [Cinara cedri]|uniref:Uncharacterized protein n=1 Tax=Cinara cedri TaxID=506608 RepID=A0A5E4M718_9HEMI|nr:Hypothetical protein CINCED_3A012859 [Cinara cedri]